MNGYEMLFWFGGIAVLLVMSYRMETSFQRAVAKAAEFENNAKVSRKGRVSEV